MFENLTKEESFQGIDERTLLLRVSGSSYDQSQVDTICDEVKELWYHIYDLDGKPYVRE